MSGPGRLPEGGAIDRDRPLRFRFDGKAYRGFAGDTLASALLANGVRLVGRSFKYHRPRGVFSAGPEEPNALVTLRTGARAEPNTRATMIDLYDGLEATSQNHWPSLGFDLLAFNNLLSPLFVAGFYYKTFMWPARFWEPVYERLIRKAAGLGAAAREPDPDRYAHRQAFCDVLVVGAGPTGIGAALAAAESGADVLLVDERAWLGGQLAYERETVEDRSAADWLAAQQQRLEQLPNVRVLSRTTAFGLYDGNVVGLVERVADHLPRPQPDRPRQCFWTVRPRRIVLATGAIERPIALDNNDRPGVVLAASVRAYANRFAVAAGREIAVFTTHDDAYRTALDLTAAGVRVPLLIDARPEPDPELVHRTRERGVEVLTGQAVLAVHGGRRVRGITFAPFTDGRVTGPERSQGCDLLAVSGGWTPTVHLHSHRGHRPVFDPQRGVFMPDRLPEGVLSAGAGNGLLDTAACLAAGRRAGRDAAATCGFQPTGETDAVDEAPLTPLILWSVPGKGKRFVDLQNDVTLSDVELSHREGYRSVEHLKRYTTLGMATDQGKTANLIGLAEMARLLERPIDRVGTTTFRPPYTPVALGTLAGPHVGRHFRPVRRTPLHDWHERHGAVMMEAGPWMRPRAYPGPGESLSEAIRREAIQVRRTVGIVDVSTLGKLEVIGPDAAEFLNRIYVNGLRKLPVGKARYGVMLRDDGLVLDDGTVARLAEDRFFVTTTTAEAAHVTRHLEGLLQTAWTELRVGVVAVTDQWAAMAVAGPRSRAVLTELVDDIDFDREAFPFAALREGHVEGVPVRVLRVSFSGENAYELYAPADYGEALWERVLETGRKFDIVPYGMEAMGTLRIEKGHVAGPELDGRTTIEDIGLARMIGRKTHFVGSVLRHRHGLADVQRPRLVGIRPLDPTNRLRAGALLRSQRLDMPDGKAEGQISSVAYSPELNSHIGLGFVANGTARHGETIYACFPLKSENIPVRIVAPVFVDPEGERIHA